MSSLRYIVNHVFFPPKRSHEDDYSCENEHALCDEVHRSAQKYKELLPVESREKWSSIISMLGNLAMSQETTGFSAAKLKKAMEEMGPGSVLALLIRAQNAGIIIRKSESRVTFESFEVSPSAAAVMSAGKLLCSYPGPAIVIDVSPHFNNECFRQELCSFLSQMNTDVLDSAATTTKAGSKGQEDWDTAHPRYITALLTGILRGIGEPHTDVVRIRKRIADDVLWNGRRLPWRRSSAWLVIRVALQTTLWNSDGKGNTQYKHFMAFLMHGIVQQARSEGYDSDLLFCMRAKLARRMYKLGESTPHFILHMVEEESEAVQQLLEERWRAIQDAQAKSPPWSIQQLNNEAKQDTALSLRNSRAYISQILSQNHPKLEPPIFRPNHPSRALKNMQHFQYTPDTLKEAFQADPFVALFDFECSVQDNLDRWVSAHISDPDASVGLHICLTEYLLHARELYKSNPEDQSVMILTLFELWVALDKIAVECHPLLKEYSPEIPLDLLQPVLLRKTTQLDRLVQIQKHLYKRHSEASRGTVFIDLADASNFAVRFFDTCPRLQQLLHDIEEEANAQRSNKRREYDELRNRYQDKMNKVRSMECQYDYDSWGDRHHHFSCPRCSLQKEAEALHIDIHEWPLPQDSNKAKVVVFEIACPLAFNFWRGATCALLDDLCRSGDSAGDSYKSFTVTATLLENYTPLRRWMDPSIYKYNYVPLELVSLASSTKSALQTHYSSKPIKKLIGSEDQIFVDNELTWGLFEKSSCSWASGGFHCSITELCTFQLPTNSPYHSLQFAISGVSHTSNFVQARQSDSPNELSIHEFISFASLRSGENLQWINIARELACRTLTFHRDEVHLLLIQAAWQVGAVSMPGGEVEWHRSLFSVNFTNVFIREARKLLRSVESNWMEIASVHTLIALCSRLLASATSAGVKQSTYDLLKDIRRVLSEWINNIRRKLEACNEESLVQDYESQLCEVAAICRATYDVDAVHLSALLQSSDDLMYFFKSSMIVYDNTPPAALTDSKLRPSLRRLVQRDRRLSFHLESTLWHRVQSDPSGLNRAISFIWPNYEAGTSWERVPLPNNRWISSETRPVGNEAAQRIHMNLLTGCLLINGKPLGRLPRSVTSHPTYNRVLSSKILKAVPSNILGMEYASQSPVFGYTLHFVMREKELVIRAKNESEDLELIPHERMNGDFPRLLVTEHVHWLDHKTREIEFRPLQALWQKDPQNWCLVGLYHDSPWSPKMHKNGSTYLIDINSRTSATISSHLKPLEHNQYLTVCLNEENVFVELPRFGVSFFVNPNNELECSNLPGIIVDRDSRAVGSLFGLSSQLVLRSVTRERPRIVLIPQGEIRYKRKADHVSVTVDTSSERYIRYYEYVVQDELGYLGESGSLEGHLYKILLHAVTSHCLPDPLTRRTGTQEALSELSSARTYSFQSLSTQSIKLLQEIGSLTPRFDFCPSHSAKVMHTMRWQDLPCISQHYDFYHLVNEILECNRRLRVFRGSGSVQDDPIRNDKALLKRYTFRHQSFYPLTDGSTRGVSAAIPDAAPYSARDNAMETEPMVCGVSASVYNAHVRTWGTVDILETLKRVNPSISGTVPNMMQILERWRQPILPSGPEISLSYSQAWLDSSFFSTNWLTLYKLCRSTEAHQCYELLFSLSSLSYKASENDLELVPIVIQFFRLPDFHNIHPPEPDSQCGGYDLSKGYEPRSEEISDMLSHYIVSLDQSRSANLERQHGESDREYGERCLRDYEDERTKALSELTDEVMGLWRTAQRPYSLSVMSIAHSHMFRRLEFEDLEKGITKRLDGCFWNLQLKKHIEQVQTVLIDSQTQSSHSRIDVISYTFQPDLSDSIRSPPGPSLLSLLGERQSPCEVAATTSNLQSFITHMQKGSSKVAQLFSTRLSQSQHALAQTHTSLIYQNPASGSEIDQYEQSCRERAKMLFGRIRTALEPQSRPETILYVSGLWPSVTQRGMIGRLSFPSRLDLPGHWRKDLVEYGRALIEYQHSLRLLQLHLKRDRDGFSKERDNNRPQGLNDEDWILVQLSGNFLARDIQIKVANEMMTPSCSKNSVIQLNMGEGKSSVIVPLIASSLAHGGQLVRIVVLSSLSVQMFQLLVDRLSGLANRRIYYLPFSRDMKLSVERARLIQTLYEECMEKGGILLTQPEHILSFRLMGLNRLLFFEDKALSSCLTNSQCWLEKHARDVFDESDELLHVKYQLVYTLGQQRPLENRPNRWTTIQEIFSLVLEHAFDLCKSHPKGLEVTYSSSLKYGTFPIIRILQDDASLELVGLLSKDVLEGRLTNLPFERFPPDTRADAKAFITEMSVESSLVERLSRNCSESTWSGLLLLRGLLAHGVLVYALQKRRWRVDYGLDDKRTLVAVPYRAKDVPSLRAEFGHPDVAIALTCLSYYYGGLTSEQLNTCFELLFNLDNPTVEYEQWISVAKHVPESLKTLSGINLNDVEQHHNVTIPLFFRNRVVIDFFLAQVVFPKFAKEFPHKLSTSGWDLAEEKANFVTGFSGTNDNQDLLPVYISQTDPVGQESTNALVLSYILRPENAYRSIERPEKDGYPPSTTEFLELLVSLTPEVRVLLDVGAQMLELTNRELAREWLTRCNGDVSAAVYFNDLDQLMVISRDNTVESFQSSQFKHQPKRCVFYLDDAHTRGIDLKFPEVSRAAVTLGEKVTKDRLVQGCMRMRKLGHGQSVIFLAPMEIDKKIRDVNGVAETAVLKPEHVIQWAYSVTFAEIEHYGPHWLKQGVDHSRRKKAWESYKVSGNTKELRDAWMQREARTLEEMYGVEKHKPQDLSAVIGSDELAIPQERCQTLVGEDVVQVLQVNVDEEQEREVSNEQEQERHLERPPEAKSAQHHVHQGVRNLVETGQVPADSADSGIVRLFSILETSAPLENGTAWQIPNLLCSVDFATVIENQKPEVNSYMRPLNWILSGAKLPDGSETLVVISPFEANELMPTIRASTKIRLHVYAPKVTQSMCFFDDLKFLTVPELPPPDSDSCQWRTPDRNSKIIMQLNLFAGQLYLADFEAYKRLCLFLGILPSSAESHIKHESDGFVPPAHRHCQPMASECPFQKSPLPALGELFSLRRKGNTFAPTHLGKIIGGRSLVKKDFMDLSSMPQDFESESGHESPYMALNLKEKK